MTPHELISDISAAEFPQAVLQRSHEVPVVVDFWAEWCGPCKVLGPILEDLTIESDGEFELAKVDVDANPELSQQFGVQGIPTVVAFRDGAVAGRFTGALPEPQVRTWLEGIMPDEMDRMVDQARDVALGGDLLQAEQIYRMVLEQRSDHHEAGTGLAGLLLARGDSEEALIVLGRLAPTPDVERLQAAARLSASRVDDVASLEAAVTADAGDDGARLSLAKALAARSEFEPALDHMLTVVTGKGEGADEARKAMLDIFELLGDAHPLTGPYRRRLASALF
ncbi:MAG TPA: thioredoxin [Acidimicrobiia bacterium]|jgi:putative thioredoxin|nr:thioredoxin [Acidimicrobiia bacterium]